MKKIGIMLLLFFVFPALSLADCPNEVYDYDTGQYLYNTDAKTKYEDVVDEACYEGYRKCINECNNSNCEDACRRGKRYCEDSK